jgi:hypothetical protein
MLTIQPQKKIVEKILTTRAGKQVRVTFAVVETAGNIEFKVLSVAPIIAIEQKTVILGLPGTVARNVVETVSHTFETLVSPYVSLFFFDSQPTRAPNL